MKINGCVNSFEFMCHGSFKLCKPAVEAIAVERPFSIEISFQHTLTSCGTKFTTFNSPTSQLPSYHRWPCKYFIYNNTYIYIRNTNIKWNRHWKTNSFSFGFSMVNYFRSCSICVSLVVGCWMLDVCAGTCSYKPGSLLSIHHRNISDIKDEKCAILFYLRRSSSTMGTIRIHDIQWWMLNVQCNCYYVPSNVWMLVGWWLLAVGSLKMFFFLHRNLVYRFIMHFLSKKRLNQWQMAL